MRVAVISDIHGNAPGARGGAGRHRAPEGRCDRSIWAITVAGRSSRGWQPNCSWAFRPTSIRGNHDRYLLTERPAKTGSVDAFTPWPVARRPHRLARRPAPTTAVVERRDLSLPRHARRSDDDALAADQRCRPGGSSSPLWRKSKLTAQAPRLSRLSAAAIPMSRARCAGGWAHRLNPGSVGRPAYTMGRSGIGRVDLAGCRLCHRRPVGVRAGTVNLRQVAYDHERAASMAVANGFPNWSEGLAREWQR